MRLDDGARDREAQPRAAAVAAARALDAVEPLGELRQVCLGNPRAAVLPDDQVLFHVYSYCPRQIRISQAVLEQVGEHLPEAIRVAEQRAGLQVFDDFELRPS